MVKIGPLFKYENVTLNKQNLFYFNSENGQSINIHTFYTFYFGGSCYLFTFMFDMPLKLF